MKTTLYTVLCIAIRLGAVLMTVDLLESIPVFLWSTQQDARFMIAVLVMAAIGLVIALVLWLKPGVLAWWAAGRGKDEVFESQIDAGQIQYIALSVLGAWLVVSGLAALVPSEMQLVRLQHLADAYPGMVPPSDAWNSLIRSLVIAVAGVILMLGARGLVGLLHRLRGYSMQPTEAADADIAPRD